MTAKQRTDAFRPALSALVASRHIDQQSNAKGETWIALRFAPTAALDALAAAVDPPAP
jgi:hypothetical protein